MIGSQKSYGAYHSCYLSYLRFPGARPLDYAMIGGLKFGVSMVIAPFATILVRKLGMRILMLIENLLLSGGCIAASFSSEIWHLYLAQVILAGLGVGLVWQPRMAILPQ